MLKRLKVLLFMMLMVSIGGVYASWSYATAKTETISVDNQLMIEPVASFTPKGKIVVKKNTLKFTLTDEDNDYFAELRISGLLEISFIPDAHANEDVKSNGVKLKLEVKEDFEKVEFGVDKSMVDLFSCKDEHVILNEGRPIKDDYTINNKTSNNSVLLSEFIDVGKIYLPTKVDYDNFINRVLKSESRIKILISEFTC